MEPVDSALVAPIAGTPTRRTEEHEKKAGSRTICSPPYGLALPAYFAATLAAKFTTL